MSDDVENKKEELYCSFCGKNQNEVRKLIAGPTVYICDECVDLCTDIIKVINRSIYENNLTKLISLGAFMNLLVFFIFLKFDYLERAKGVIISTLCVAILTIYLNNF